jgi:dGTPase
MSEFNAMDREAEHLAGYAMTTRRSRGRIHNEPEHAFRTIYQRDRDRIIHSVAFRRLMYKTQVLVNSYSDHHRTRLTHTLEVAQISRTIARQLQLNEDLTEAIALAHDLGHPPFGHAGERLLHQRMAEHGGFEHNRHGLRLVQMLEHRYPNFPGLNLSWELLESMAYHSKLPEAPEVKQFRPTGQPFLEAQVVDAADSLAYDAHDLDDAVSVGLIQLDDIRELSFCRAAEERMVGRYGSIPHVSFQPALIRCLIDWQVLDLMQNIRNRLDEFKIKTVEDVRELKVPIAQPSEGMMKWKVELESFLTERVYRHQQVQRMTVKAQRFLSKLFDELLRSPGLMPPRHFRRVQEVGLHLAVCDYLASMTDRFAQEEFRRIFLPDDE